MSYGVLLGDLGSSPMYLQLINRTKAIRNYGEAMII